MTHNTKHFGVPAALTGTFAILVLSTSPAMAMQAEPATNPFSQMMQGGVAGPLVSTVEIIGRLLLAVALSGVLAFRPRKNVPLFRRSLYVSQTQILLSVVAA